MSVIHLVVKEQPSVPLEAECISPDSFAELSNDEIRALRVYHGKRQCRVDDFFDVDGEKSDHIQIHGDVGRVRWLGRAMTRGTLQIYGDVGMHLGAYMKNGRIEVHGNAGDWIGAEMKNGFVHIHGDAGGQIGAAYRGSLRGMKNGTIIVDGTAGIEVGMRMRRGTIVVGGKVRDFAGLQMKGGTLVLLGGAEIRTGAWMTRGTIISLKPIQLMPTFRTSGPMNPMFMNVYARQLGKLGIDLPFDRRSGSYIRHCGDMSIPGKGELFVWQS